jgi:hypothetical protein
MTTLINFMLGALLAAALIAPQVWTDFGKLTQSGVAVVRHAGPAGRHPKPIQAAIERPDTTRNS